jgi:predicted Zn-dependent peptidase
VALFQTKSRTVPFATAIVFQEMKRIVAEPVTEQELQTTISGIIERFPRAFATKGQIAGTFAQDEFTGRYAKNPNFWQSYRAQIQQVDRAAVQRAAQRLLTPERAVILVVGERDEILKGHPDHAERLHDFAGGNVIELPLRDPLTLVPQAAPKPIAKP